MSTLKVCFSAHGRKNGCTCSIHELNHGVPGELTIDSSRWYSAGNSGREAIMLNAARNQYPEVDWESASEIEIRQL
jgi:hypothetical protein